MHIEDLIGFGKPHEHKRHHPVKVALFAFLWVLLALVIIAIPVLASASRMASEAMKGRTALTQAMTSAKVLDVAGATASLTEARMHLVLADRFGTVLAPFEYAPFVGQDVSDARTIIRSSLETATALERVAVLGEGILNTLAKAGEFNAKAPTVPAGVISFFRLTPSERQNVLVQLDKVPADFTASVAEIDKAITGFDSLTATDGKYFSPIIASLKPIIGELRDIRERLVSAASLAKLLPALSGYPTAKRYLILMQNDTELRPTGGFIGTIGSVTLENANARDLKASDVYALDGYPGAKLPPAPAPLVKYLSADKWYLRDSNWSPDFPTSAKQILSTYLAEGGTENYDGVIAIDTTLAADMLKIVGNVKVGTSVFTPENVTDEIEYQVEKGFSNKGIPVAQRKDILVALVGEVFSRALTLPANRWPEIVVALVTALDGKHMLITSSDPAVSQFVRNRNWDGMLRQDEGDFLMVVDANLASLKTDSVIKRSVDYSVKTSGNDLVANVKIKYTNRGGFSWKTSRYRTYTRIYVPVGSELISVSGNMANDKILDPKRSAGTVDTVDELGRRSFGTFISVEPGETRELIFTYKLSPRISLAAFGGAYQLLVQKQPGIGAVPLTLGLDFGKRVMRAVPAEHTSQWGDDVYYVTSDLAVDRQFVIGF